MDRWMDYCPEFSGFQIRDCARIQLKQTWPKTQGLALALALADLALAGMAGAGGERARTSSV